MPPSSGSPPVVVKVVDAWNLFGSVEDTVEGNGGLTKYENWNLPLRVPSGDDTVGVSKDSMINSVTVPLRVSKAGSSSIKSHPWSASFVEMDGKMTDSGDPEQRVPIENFSKMSLKVHGCDLIELDPALDPRICHLAIHFDERCRPYRVCSLQPLPGRFGWFETPLYDDVLARRQPPVQRANAVRSASFVEMDGKMTDSGDPEQRVPIENFSKRFHDQLSDGSASRV
jgi:hypothetical protein